MRFQIVLIAVVLTATVNSSTLRSSKVSSEVLQKLSSNTPSNIIISFVGGNKPALSSLSTLASAGATRAEKITQVRDVLQSHANRIQAPVLKYLQSSGVSFKSLWISNIIVARNVPSKVVEHLALNFPEIQKLSLDSKLNYSPIEKKISPVSLKQEDLAWGLTKIEVREAWNVTNGTGVVVGLVDTGARWTHEAIKDSFIGLDYGWFDPILGALEPYDSAGHGTHVQGTITGTHGVGIAPGAKWMACQSCALDCDLSWWVVCSEWMLCPTLRNGSNPDCSKAPHVINNSWGDPSGVETDFFDAVANAWRAAGIIPIFAAGNEYSCSSLRTPGTLANVITTGATDMEDSIASFSSKGPTQDGRTKPDLSAPGQNVYSAMPGSDSQYGHLSGTSMASPHVAGVATLLLSAYPNITYDGIKEALVTGVEQNLAFTNQTCGGTRDDSFPNNIFGNGRLNARLALEVASKF